MIIKKLNATRAKDVVPLMLELYSKWDKMDPIDKIDKKWFASRKAVTHIRKIIKDRDKLFLVAYEENEIIGYLIAEYAERQPFLEKVGYVAETYIHSEFRGQGVGSSLYRKAQEWFIKKKLKWICVGTHSLDTEAISFWERKGFKEFNKYFKLKR